MKDYAKPYTSRKSDVLEEIILTVLGVISFIATSFLFAYSVLGGF
tara:strand:- start:407 stop:541 length:135 start_codon:yes stop_codon:yes gene_type:complete